jgi:hypothetical protein
MPSRERRMIIGRPISAELGWPIAMPCQKSFERCCVFGAALSVRPWECSRQLLSPITIGQFGWEAVADFALAWALNPTAIDERL